MSTATTTRFYQWTVSLRDPGLRERWRRIAKDFIRHHRNPLNNLLHAVATPLGVSGVLALLAVLDVRWALAAAMVYAAALWFAVPIVAWVPSVLCLSAGTAVAAWATQIDASPLWAIAAIVVGYGLQDVSHWLCGESTLQGDYTRSDATLGQKVFSFAEHCFYQLPLTALACVRVNTSPLDLLVRRKRVLPTHLDSAQAADDLRRIRDWADTQCQHATQSVHWWQESLPGEVRQSFAALAEDSQMLRSIRRHHGPAFAVRPVLRMNELYVTGPPKTSTSDTVFYTPHIDGPWAVWPCSSVYRCMLAASENPLVTTHFPMDGAGEKQTAHRLETGHAVAFDFNRELHYITRKPAAEYLAESGDAVDSGADQAIPTRVNLKLHFVAYPKKLPWLGQTLAAATTAYDRRAREWFLETLQPKTLLEKSKAKLILGCTNLFDKVASHAGWSNVTMLIVLAAITIPFIGYWAFVFATAYVHYAIYLATMRHRGGVSYGHFVRDAIFFKAVSMTQLFVLYAISGPAWWSIAIAAAGFSISALAALRLGKLRTYYGSELGVIPGSKETRFPYGWLPHPMIAGSVIGLIGMLVATTIGQPLGWLIIGHIVCYTWVLAQEMSHPQ